MTDPSHLLTTSADAEGDHTEDLADIAHALTRTSRDLSALRVGVERFETTLALPRIERIERALHNIKRDMVVIRWMLMVILVLEIATTLRVYSK